MVAEIFHTNRNSFLLVGILFVGVLLLYRARASSGGGVRFHLSFLVSVDGAEETGSSIINVLFYGRDGTEAGNPYECYTVTEGVALVINLDKDGWLVATMQSLGVEYVRRKKRYGLACAEP